MQDAGTNHVDHYRLRMDGTRFKIRQWLLEYVRKETDVLAAFQRRVRTPFWDFYFATTANLGTHMFYMIMLPVFCWCDYMHIGESVITVLAIGVYLTGYIKDYVCLPRPRSPPLHRISTSGSATQEYGFPSTHCCNALSVMLVFLVDNDAPTAVYWICFVLGISIVAGRLYTGMHGFLDVGFGLICGYISWILSKWILWWFHTYMRNANSFPWLSFIAAIFGLIALVVFHPQPVDPCPCYDDSVAFLSVVLGVELSGAMHTLGGGTWPYYEHTGMLRSFVRFVVGVTMVVVWRYVAKRILLRVLPPLWRFFDESGISLPRRNYLRATEYDEVPRDLPDEILPESPKDIATMIRTVRRTHGRSDSVGPQNIADVYEAEAYRQSAPVPAPDLPKSADKDIAAAKCNDKSHNHSIVMPRVRYDVEIVTKIVVYAGIAITAASGAPAVFDALNI